MDDDFAKYLSVKKGRTIEDIMVEFDIGERTAYARIKELRESGIGFLVRVAYAPARYSYVAP